MLDCARLDSLSDWTPRDGTLSCRLNSVRLDSYLTGLPVNQGCHKNGQYLVASVWSVRENINENLSVVTVSAGFPLDCSHHHHHLFIYREGRWGTTDDFATSFLHVSLFSTALWDLTNSRPVHFLMSSSHLFLCLPCLRPPFAVPCKMVLARPDDRKTRPYHCSLRLSTTVRRSPCGPTACWISAWTSSLVTWSVCEVRGVFRTAGHEWKEEGVRRAAEPSRRST